MRNGRNISLGNPLLKFRQESQRAVPPIRHRYWWETEELDRLVRFADDLGFRKKINHAFKIWGDEVEGFHQSAVDLLPGAVATIQFVSPKDTLVIIDDAGFDMNLTTAAAIRDVTIESAINRGENGSPVPRSFGSIQTTLTGIAGSNYARRVELRDADGVLYTLRNTGGVSLFVVFTAQIRIPDVEI